MDAVDLFHSLAVDSTSASAAGRYVDWWVVHISVANLLVIILMVVTFVAALLLPFPGRDTEWAPAPPEAEDRGGADR